MNILTQNHSAERLNPRNLSCLDSNNPKDRDEDDIKAVASRNAAIINDDDDDSNEPSILQMAKLPERSTTPELLQPEPATAAEPEPGMGARFNWNVWLQAAAVLYIKANIYRASMTF